MTEICVVVVARLPCLLSPLNVAWKVPAWLADGVQENEPVLLPRSVNVAPSGSVGAVRKTRRDCASVAVTRNESFWF